MSDPREQECRPLAGAAPSKSFGGDNGQSTAPLDLVTMHPADWSAWRDGYSDGFRDGIDRGRELVEQELQRGFELSRRIVHAAADHPRSPGQRAADERAAERRAAWWAARRGGAA